MCTLHDLQLATDHENIASGGRAEMMAHQYSRAILTFNPITVTVDQVTNGLFHFVANLMLL